MSVSHPVGRFDIASANGLTFEFKSEMAKLRVDTQRLMVGAMAANTVAVAAALLT